MGHRKIFSHNQEKFLCNDEEKCLDHIYFYDTSNTCDFLIHYNKKLNL